MTWICSATSSLTGRMLTGIFTLLLILAPLASCSTPASVTPQFGTINVSIPSQALKSPVIGQLPNNTVLHLRITFKMDQNVIKQLQNTKIQPGKRSNLETVANKLGIDESTYQKIQNFFNTQHIAVKLSRLHTFLSVDAKAGKVARLLQTKFVVHNYHGRKFYAPDTKQPPKAPQFLLNYIDVVTGLDNYSAPPSHQSTLSFAHTKNVDNTASTKQTRLFPSTRFLAAA